MNNLSSILVNNTSDDLLKTKGVPDKIYELIYQNGAPWEVGAAQPAIIELEQQGMIESPILDIGCGYGANSYYLASKNYQVCAIDYLTSVIKTAREKNHYKNLQFLHKNALELNEFLTPYKTIIDSATFHGFSDKERINYANQLKKFLQPNAIVHILGFSDREIRHGGPRRLSRNIFDMCFGDGWKILSTRYLRYDTTLYLDGAEAILCSIQRL